MRKIKVVDLENLLQSCYDINTCYSLIYKVLSSFNATQSRDTEKLEDVLVRYLLSEIALYKLLRERNNDYSFLTE